MADRSRRAAAMDREAQDKEKGKSAYAESRGYLLGDDELDALGVAKFGAPAEKDGTAKQHRLSIIDPHPEDGDPFQLGLFVHYGVGVKRDIMLCPVYMGKQFGFYGIKTPEGVDLTRCPICEEMDRLRALQREATTEDEKDAIYDQFKGLRPFGGKWSVPHPNRHLVWVLDSATETTEEEGPMLWLMPHKVYDEGVLEYSKSSTGVRLNITDPSENGYCFLFKREGSGQDDTKYTGYRFEPRGYNIPDELLAVPRYTDVLVFYSYDEMKKVFETGVSTEAKAPAAAAGAPPPASTESVDAVRERLRRRRAEAAAPATAESAPAAAPPVTGPAPEPAPPVAAPAAAPAAPPVAAPPAAAPETPPAGTTRRRRKV